FQINLQQKLEQCEIIFGIGTMMSLKISKINLQRGLYRAIEQYMLVADQSLNIQQNETKSRFLFSAGRMEMERIRTYKPTVSSVSQARVLMIGPLGAGKSSFFNSINSVFRGHITNQAMSSSSSTSLTTQFRAYSLKDGREGKLLPIALCDTMGLDESKGAGLNVDDISSILQSHLPDSYQVFNYILDVASNRNLKDKIHCVVYVFDTCKVSIMSNKLEEKLEAIRSKVNLQGIPRMMEVVSTKLGVPLSCIVPVKNYTRDLELDLNCDVLLLSAVIQMLHFADNYFDEGLRRSPM
uniref:G domain-containing protein n=1 Tax=Nothobranchius furzeri TaxID=105023 RepID=A0A8C6PJV8_NOTFU